MRIAKQRGQKSMAILLFLGSASSQPPERWSRGGTGEEKGVNFQGVAQGRAKAGSPGMAVSNSNHTVNTLSSMLCAPVSLLMSPSCPAFPSAHVIYPLVLEMKILKVYDIVYIKRYHCNSAHLRSLKDFPGMLWPKESS